jgi:hypothetical protein
LVITPDAGVPSAGVVNVGLVNVLLVKVSVVALPTRVSVPVGIVIVPELEILAITGVVNVLLVKVSVVALPTKVSVVAGSVNVISLAAAPAVIVVLSPPCSNLMVWPSMSKVPAILIGLSSWREVGRY